jgi:hypothetical protein
MRLVHDGRTNARRLSAVSCSARATGFSLVGAIAVHEARRTALERAKLQGMLYLTTRAYAVASTS